MPSTNEFTQAVIDLLLAAGFVPDGLTAEQTVRVPTKGSPLYGRSGGVLATFGGRARLTMPGTDFKATVGARTTYLYRAQGGNVRGIAHLSTRDIAAVQSALASLSHEQPAARERPRG